MCWTIATRTPVRRAASTTAGPVMTSWPIHQAKPSIVLDQSASSSPKTRGSGARKGPLVKVHKLDSVRQGFLHFRVPHATGHAVNLEVRTGCRDGSAQIRVERVDAAEPRPPR